MGDREKKPVRGTIYQWEHPSTGAVSEWTGLTNDITPSQSHAAIGFRLVFDEASGLCGRRGSSWGYQDVNASWSMGVKSPPSRHFPLLGFRLARDGEDA